MTAFDLDGNNAYCVTADGVMVERSPSYVVWMKSHTPDVAVFELTPLPNNAFNHRGVMLAEIASVEKETGWCHVVIDSRGTTKARNGEPKSGEADVRAIWRRAINPRVSRRPDPPSHEPWLPREWFQHLRARVWVLREDRKLHKTLNSLAEATLNPDDFALVQGKGVLECIYYAAKNTATQEQFNAGLGLFGLGTPSFIRATLQRRRVYRKVVRPGNLLRACRRLRVAFRDLGVRIDTPTASVALPRDPSGGLNERSHL